MKWLAIARKDGKSDPYAIGLCSHTIATVFAFNVAHYEAWRMPNTRLGSFDTVAEAKSACEADLKQAVERAA